jgi:hypothetical protein
VDLAVDVPQQDRAIQQFQCHEVPRLGQFAAGADEMPGRQEKPFYLALIVLRVYVMIRLQQILKSALVNKHRMRSPPMSCRVRDMEVADMT